jgi:hypothetical protein
MSEQNKNIVIVLEPLSKAVEDLVAAIEQKGQAEVMRVASPEEVAQLAPQYQPCMLIACIPDNPYIPGRVNLFKKLEKASLKSGLLKTMVISQVKNKQLATLVASLGISDYMEEPVPLRTMQFKANLQLKAVDTIKKQQEMKRKSQEQIVFKKSDSAKNESNSQVGAKVAAKSKPALQLEQDTFLFKNAGAKKVGGKVSVELEGPDPESGDWVQHEDKGNAQTSWRWVPKDEKERESLGGAEGKDGWVHQGEKPQFQEQSGKWQFVSEKPDLSFNRKGESLGKKLSTDESGELVVAEDSAQAEEKVKAVREKIALRQKTKNTEKTPLGQSSPEIEAKESQSSVTDPNSAKETQGDPEFRDLQSKGDGPNSTPLMDKRSGKPDELSPFSQKTTKEKEDEADAAPKEVQKSEQQNPEKKKLSPLDFLKNKRAALESGLEKISEFGETELPSEEGQKENLSPEDQSDADEDSELALSKKAKESKKARNPTEELLARLKAKAEKGENQKVRLEEEVSLDANEGEPTEETSEEEIDEIGEAIKKRKLEKKKKEAESTLSAVDLAAEDSPEAKPTKPLSAIDKAKNNRKERAQLLSELQEAVEEPITDAISSADEKELRKKYDKPGAPPLKPRELKRKAKLDKLKALKDRLGNLDTEMAELEKDHPELKTHDLRPDELENTQSQRGDIGSTSDGVQRRAFDSELEEELDPENNGKLSKKDKDESRKRDREIAADQRFYKPREEITPLGGAWERADTHYVFISAGARYKGFEKLEELIPLWIFEGEKVPELLDKTDQWQFYGKEPFKALSLKEVPSTVRDFLLELRDSLRKNEQGPSELESRKKLQNGEALEELISKRSPNGDETSATQNEDSPILLNPKPKKQKVGSSLLDLMKKVEAGSDEILAATEESTETNGGETPPLAGDEAQPPAERKTQAATLEELFEGKEEKTKKNHKNSAVSDRLANLKAAMDSEASNMEEGSSNLESSNSAGESRNEHLSEQDQETKRTEDAPIGSDSSPLEEKLKAKSPAFEKFLARRKEKEALRAVESTETSRTKAETPQGAEKQNQPYLAVYVALSNAFMPNQTPERGIERVLKALSLSIEGAHFALESGGVTLCASASQENLQTQPIQKEEVRRNIDERAEILGYLSCYPNRSGFVLEPAQVDLMKRVTGMIWPLVDKIIENKSEGKAA